jgi:hypothetical protein
MPSFVYTNRLVDRRSAPINPDWVLEGAPVAQAAAVTRSRDGTANTVLWDCSPGEFNWFYDRDETAYIIEGVAILDEGLPSEQYMRAGDVVYFPAGSRVHWRVQSHIHKVAFVRRSLPVRLMRTLHLLRRIKHALTKSGNQTEGMFDTTTRHSLTGHS